MNPSKVFKVANIKVPRIESEEARKWRLHQEKQLQKKRDLATLKTANLVQSLPQELFDAIFDFSMTTDVPDDNIIHIDKKYKPPKSLHITKALRKSTAKVYFSTSTFSFVDLGLSRKWVIAQDPVHSLQIQTMQYDARESAKPWDGIGVGRRLKAAYDDLGWVLASDVEYWESNPGATWSVTTSWTSWDKFTLPWHAFAGGRELSMTGVREPPTQLELHRAYSRLLRLPARDWSD